jgi:hypothetical protein
MKHKRARRRRTIAHTRNRRNGRSVTHVRGVGAFETPANVQAQLDALSNEELLDSIEVGPFVDPFVMAEIGARGLTGAVFERDYARRQAAERKGFRAHMAKLLSDDEHAEGEGA